MIFFWRNRSLREQYILIAGVALTLITGMYILILHPALNRINYYQDSILKKEKDLIWMKNAARQIREHHIYNYQDQNLSALAVIDKSAKTLNLNKAINRLEPDDSGQIRVWMSGAVFDNLLIWLDNLRNTYGITMTSFKATPQKDKRGIVDAQLIFITANKAR